MEKITKVKDIQQYIIDQKHKGIQLGFVPTMGALHQGHLELIKQAKEENDKVICSIFVNPLQFNRKEDLESYPIRIEKDIEMLENINCDVLFTPQSEELYAQKVEDSYSFGSIALEMEGAYRPGHFEGVAAVIERFFSIITADKAYFGEKDYQQLAIIKWVKKHFNFPIEIIGCKTVRDENGLALSSRNYLLTKQQLQTATQLYDCMHYCKAMKNKKTPHELISTCLQKLGKDFKIEYIKIVDEDTLLPINNWSDTTHPRVFIAAYLSHVRLIDNLSLID